MNDKSYFNRLSDSDKDKNVSFEEVTTWLEKEWWIRLLKYGQKSH